MFPFFSPSNFIARITSQASSFHHKQDRTAVAMEMDEKESCKDWNRYKSEVVVHPPITSLSSQSSQIDFIRTLKHNKSSDDVFQLKFIRSIDREQIKFAEFYLPFFFFLSFLFSLSFAFSILRSLYVSRVGVYLSLLNKFHVPIAE